MIDLTLRVLSFAILLQTIEIISIRDSWKIWQGVISDRLFAGIIAVQAAAAILNLLSPNSICTAILFLCATANIYKWRGFFNGGSDAMAFVILLGCLIPHKVGIYLIMAQVVLSYFVAGVVKAKNKSWWTGQTLWGILHHSAYAVPEFIRQRTNQKVAQGLAIATVLFELSAPLVFVSKRFAAGFVLIAIGFHFANFVILGLNRFVWVWGAGLLLLIN